MDEVRSAMRKLTFRQLAIDLRIDVVFYLKEDETDRQRAFRKLEDDGVVGVMSTFADDPGKRLEGVLNRKISYLRKFNDPDAETRTLPYLAIIFDPDSSVDPMDMEKVLHGSSIGYDLGSGTLCEELRQWTQRSRHGRAVSYEEGLYSGSRKGFLAVLKCTGDFRYDNGCKPSVWVNPYADLFRIPKPFFQLKTYLLSRQIDCTPPA